MIYLLTVLIAYAACCYGQSSTGSGSSFTGNWMYYPSGIMMTTGGIPEGTINGYTNPANAGSGATIMTMGILTSSKFYAYGSVSYTDSGTGSTPMPGMYTFPICASGNFKPAASGTWKAKGNIGATRLRVSGIFGMEGQSGTGEPSGTPSMSSMLMGTFSTNANLPAQSSWMGNGKKFMKQCGPLMVSGNTGSGAGGTTGFSVYGSLYFGTSSGSISVTYSETDGIPYPMANGQLTDASGMSNQMISLASLTPANGAYTAVGIVGDRPFTAKGKYVPGGMYSGFYTIDKVKVSKHKCDAVGSFVPSFGSGTSSMAMENLLTGNLNCHDSGSATPGMNSFSVTAKAGSLYGLSYNSMMSASGSGSPVSIGSYGAGLWNVATELNGLSVVANGQYGSYGAYFADKLKIKCATPTPGTSSGSAMGGMESVTACGSIRTRSGVKSLSMKGYVGAEKLRIIKATITTSGSGAGTPGMEMAQLSGYAKVGTDASFPIEGYFYGASGGNINAVYVDPSTATGSGSGTPSTTISFNAQVATIGKVAFFSYGTYSKM